MEFIDIVDGKDQVVGKATYADIYLRLLTHRIVHILIFNDRGEMAIQKRSKSKSFMPSAWSTAVGDHVRSGETYEQAALREFREELGMYLPLELLSKDPYEDRVYEKGLKKFLTTFKCDYNGPFSLNHEEVESIDFFSLKEIKTMIKRGDKFHPELLFLLKVHYAHVFNH